MAQRVPQLFERLIAVHEALERGGFEHAIGGAIALSTHIRDPRTTRDIDLNIIANPARPEPLLACLPSEIQIHGGARNELMRDGQTRLIWPDPRTPVDIFLPQHPVFHHSVAARAQPIDFFGTPIKVLAATDLMVFKMLFNRGKDWVDIIEIVRAGTADTDEAKGWIAELLGEDDSRIATLNEIIETTEVIGFEDLGAMPEPVFRWPTPPA